MPADSSRLPLRPPSEPVELISLDRSHRAVLENLGQLYRYDLSEAYRHLPNPDGTFNNRRLDRFLAGIDSEHRAWLITVAGALGGFRRTGVGREAAARVIAMIPGRWSIGYQSYNPGAQRFWSQVASDAVGDKWATHDDPPAEGRPPDTWITFQT